MPDRHRYLLLIALAGLAACERAEPTAGESAESQIAASSNEVATIRKRYRKAVAAQDSAAARSAVDALEAALPKSPDTAAELSRMWAAIGETNRARWLLEQAVERDPDHYELLLGLAETSLNVGDAVGALETLGRMPETAPRYPYALLLRARAEIQLGDLERGLATLEAAETRFPETEGFWVERIQVLQLEKRETEALELLRSKQRGQDLPAEQRAWLDLHEAALVGATEGHEAELELLDRMLVNDPTSGDVLQRRTAILLASGHADAALPALEAAVVQAPEADGLHSLLAGARLSQGDGEGAEQALRGALEARPGMANASQLALFLYQQGRAGEGAAILGQTIDASDASPGVELLYLQVAMLIEAGELERAGRLFEAFQRAYPANPRVDYLRARFDLERGDAESAARRLTEVVSRLDRSDVKHLLGAALELTGDIEGAEQRYGLATIQNPQQLSSWIGLLRTLEAQQKWTPLLDVATRLIRIDPMVGAAYSALVRGQLALGHPERAEVVLREYAKRFPKLPGPRAGLVLALRKQGRLEEALAETGAALEEFPDAPGVLAERAVVLGRLGRVAEGLELVDSATPEVMSGELRRARLYLLFASERKDEALAELEEIIAADPYDAGALVMAGNFLSSRGEFGPAAERYRLAMQRAPRDASVAFRLAIALERSSDADAAIGWYQRAIELDEGAIGARNNLALVLEREGRLPEALAAAQAAYGLAEGDPVVMDTLGTLYVASGRVERGIALLEKAREVEPPSADLVYHLALAYRQAGRTAEARSLLDELSQRLEPGDDLHEPVGKALAALR
jgi:tetratricopeptide (TPR) repeat protein